MAASKPNPPPPNLATLLLIKRKMSGKNNPNSRQNQASLPTDNSVGAYSQEKIIYRQDPSVEIPTNKTNPENTNDPPKRSRKAKQLEVNQLDKKIEEINRKQEAQKNEALDSWKGFDDVNYGLPSEPEAHKSPTPIPPTSAKQVN